MRNLPDKSNMGERMPRPRYDESALNFVIAGDTPFPTSLDPTKSPRVFTLAETVKLTGLSVEQVLARWVEFRGTLPGATFDVMPHRASTGIQTVSADGVLSGDLGGFRLVFVAKPISINGKGELELFADFDAQTIYVSLQGDFECAIRNAFGAGLAAGREARPKRKRRGRGDK